MAPAGRPEQGCRSAAVTVGTGFPQQAREQGSDRRSSLGAGELRFVMEEALVVERADAAKVALLEEDSGGAAGSPRARAGGSGGDGSATITCCFERRLWRLTRSRSS